MVRPASGSFALFVCATVAAFALFWQRATATVFYGAVPLTGPSVGTTSTSIGLAYLQYDNVTMVLSYTLFHNVTNATMSHIHGPGASPTSGASIMIWLSNQSTPTSAPSPIVGTANISTANAEIIFNNDAYINLHSQAYPNGEIAGEITFPSNTMVTLLSGSADVPQTNSTATGVGYVTVYPSTQTLDCMLFNNVVNATMAHIHGAALPGFNAPPVVTLSSCTSVGCGTGPFYLKGHNYSAISAAFNSSAFLQNLFYFNVHSVVYGSGEIRGNLQNLVAAPQYPSPPNPKKSASLPSALLSSVVGTLSVALVLALLG